MALVSTSGYIGSFTDVASAARTATFTSDTFRNDAGNSSVFDVIVTAASGTNPTLDIVLQESMDGGLNWVNRYAFARVTAATTLRSPKLERKGLLMRYVCTIGGATPSFTFIIIRNVSNNIGTAISQFIDRAITLNTIDSVTAWFNTADCNNIQLVANTGAITTTAPQYQLEGSDDGGVTAYAIGSPLTAVASSTVQTTTTGRNSNLTRVRVSTAGVGATLGHLLVKGF
jgi:hypothetical protein